ncbi:MAG: succinate dehydrogenase, cytochrome b556 subunit [Gammaproteobacteria bacterium]|nr:succinate dehydrogenase, cytochrome b556 subunit [Gammaproteobacteria bacterium]
MAIQRPISPHISIYRWELTMVMSIVHRATGGALAASMVLVTWWLAAVATGGSYYESARQFLASGLGQLLLLAWSFALFYHLCNGIRHLVWDSGRGFAPATARQSGIIVIVCALVLTVIQAYLMLGGAS